MSDFEEVLSRRTATREYVAKEQVTLSELKELIAEATQAPSSFNLQHWRFVAVTDGGLREKLAATTLPSNRQRVFDAAMNLLVLGDTKAHAGLAPILEAAVTAGTLERETADEQLRFATEVYGHNEELARNEAIRSCSLAAMTLMLAASNRGWSTCPIGFNMPEVLRILNVPERFVPVMWLTIGRAAGRPSMRKPRRPVAEILTVNTAPSGA